MDDPSCFSSCVAQKANCPALIVSACAHVMIGATGTTCCSCRSCKSTFFRRLIYYHLRSNEPPPPIIQTDVPITNPLSARCKKRFATPFVSVSRGTTFFGENKSRLASRITIIADCQSQYFSRVDIEKIEQLVFYR